MKKMYAGLLGVTLLVPAVVLGATVGVGEEYTLRSSESVSGNLYAAGGYAALDGSVGGDALVVGGNVVMAGTVAQDAAVAGGTVNISGPVRGDLRIVGGNVTIAGDVSGDLAVLGGFVHLLSASTVLGDVLVAGGKVVLDGEIKGGIKAVAGELDVNGIVHGALVARIGDSLRLGPYADIRDGITYRAPQEVAIQEGAKIAGAVTYTPFEKSSFKPDAVKAGLFAVLGTIFILKLLAFAVAGIVAILVFRNFSQGVTEQALADFWGNILRGAVVLILGPVLALLLCATILGALPGAALGLIFALMVLASCAYAGIIAALWVHKAAAKRKDLDARWYHAVLGTVALGILGLVPFVGWFINLVVFLVAVGSVSYIFYKKFWLTR